MFPVLFSFGPVTIYSFGVFCVLAFLLTAFVFWRKGKEEHYAEDELLDAFLISLFWGIIASRIGFIALHFSVFNFNLWQWFDIFGAPGFIPFFGVVVALVSLYRFAKNQKWNMYEILDFASLSLALGYAVLWLGAFFNGSGFGNPTTLPIGMTFPLVFEKYHPTQLYGFIIYLLLFTFLSWAEVRYRTFEWYRSTKHSAQTGFLFAVFCMVYGLAGIGLGAIMPAQIIIRGIPLDLPIRGIIFAYGLLLLYVRSGRSLLPWRK